MDLTAFLKNNKNTSEILSVAKINLTSRLKQTKNGQNVRKSGF